MNSVVQAARSLIRWWATKAKTRWQHELTEIARWPLPVWLPPHKVGLALLKEGEGAFYGIFDFSHVAPVRLLLLTECDFPMGRERFLAGFLAELRNAGVTADTWDREAAGIRISRKE